MDVLLGTRPLLTGMYKDRHLVLKHTDIQASCHTQTDMILTQTHIHTDVSEAYKTANSMELQPVQFLPSRNPQVLPHLLPQVAPPN